MPARYTIPDMQFLAKQMGGKCLSREYGGYRTPLRWMCKRGHIFNNCLYMLAKGKFCARCAKAARTINRGKVKFEKLQQIARGRGGECLSKKFVSDRSLMKWRCSKGHVWQTVSLNILNGKWCHVCGVQKRVDSTRSDIEEFRQIARSRGGKLLSDRYINSQTHLEWECAKGHRWMSTPNNIKFNAWCSVCGKIKQRERNRVVRFKECLKLAHKHGGKLLSKKYIASAEPLKWQCSKGHQWIASLSVVKHFKRWCLVCSGSNHTKNIIRW